MSQRHHLERLLKVEISRLLQQKIQIIVQINLRPGLQTGTQEIHHSFQNHLLQRTHLDQIRVSERPRRTGQKWRASSHL